MLSKLRLWRRTPKPVPPDWVLTGNEEWRVIKERDGFVREQLHRERLDLNTGTRAWFPSFDSVHYSRFAITRIRNTNEVPHS